MNPAADETPALQAGLALLRNNQARSAETFFEALARTSDSAQVWYCLGVARHALGKLPQAIEAFRGALATRDEPETRCALAAVLGQAGDWTEAEHALVEGLDRAPGHAGLHFNLAVALEHRGAETEALGHYDAALAAEPAHPQALLNRGALHLRAARYDEAHADFDSILDRDPASVDALLNRNRTLLLQFRDDEALQAVRAAQRIAPQRPDVRRAVAATLASMGFLDASDAEMRGEAWNALLVYMARATARMDSCIWDDYQRMVDSLQDALLKPGALASIADPGLYVHMLALPFTGEQLRIAASAIAADIQPVLASVPLAAPPRRARVRIGLIPGVVGHHPDTYLIRRVASDLDRSRFEVYLYGLNADDKSDARRDLIARADVFRDLSALDSAGMVDAVRRDELDVAVDSGGFFKPARPEIFKARIAPVQVAYLAMPGPHGEGVVDYRLADPEATPASLQDEWTEKLLLVPGPHWTYDNRIERGPAGRRADHGLPEHGFVFCCLTQAWKLDPETFAIWMRLLKAVEGSVLWLLESGPANERLRAAAEAAGVDPMRLVFAPRVGFPEHLGRLSHAGVFLDTLYFNAQTTAIDALWAGLPIVTRTRRSMTSRIISTFLRSAGLADLVTGSADAYEALALKLAREPVTLARYRERLAAAHKGAPLFDTAARVRAFERAILAIVERHAAGLPPETLTVG